MALTSRSASLETPSLHTKAYRLVFGRIGLILLLLLANLWRTTGFIDPARSESSDELVIMFALAAGLTIIYFISIRFAPRTLDQVRIQLAIDLVLITWLVWQTGDIISPYVTLYIVLISVSGFFLAKTETLFLAIGCAASFTALSILTAQDVLVSGSGDQPASRILQIVGVNDVAILLVGLLAARLSERRQLSDELKHTEESFADLHMLHERIVESISSGLITTDLVGRIYAFNRSAEEITGMKPSSAIGKSIFELFGPEMRRRVEECLDAGTRGEALRVQFETGFQNGSGPPRVTAACTIVPLTGKSGLTNGVIVSLQDVSQMKALEETVRRSDRLAAVGRMAAGLAHEIRNPLGSMSSALQFLQESSARPDAESALMDVVLRESERMNSIITNFLAFARPSANTGGSAREDVNVAAALSDCLSLIRHSPEVSDSHRIETEIPDEPVLINADETQLKQVFWNLARNAMEAMPSGGKLSVSLAKTGRGMARIEFRDDGVGMSKKTLEHVFEPFTGESGGTGLGLSIVYKIVNDHGGTISIKSKPAGGTTVWVEFPAATAAVADGEFTNS
jgi:two-component system, NtrC family, sensor histidine kinase PilS